MALDQEEVILKSVSFTPWIEGISYKAGASRAMSDIQANALNDIDDVERWFEKMRLNDREDDTRRNLGDFAGTHMQDESGGHRSLASAEAVLATESLGSDWEQVFAVEKARLDSPRLTSDVLTKAAAVGRCSSGGSSDYSSITGGVRRAPSGLKKRRDNVVRF